MAVYGSWVETIIDDNLTGATLKALLVTSSYSQNHSHQFRSSITNEVSGTGYTSGGLALTGVSIAVSDGAARLHCDDIEFGILDVSDIGGIVFYIDNGSSATDVLIASDVFEDPVDAATSGLPVTYVVPDDGLLVADFTI